MPLHVQTLSGKRTKALYRKGALSPHARVTVGQSANFAQLATATDFPEVSRCLVGDLSQVNAEAALFGKYPLFGLPAIVRNDPRFKAILLDMSESAAANTPLVNGVNKSGVPVPGATKVSNRTVTSGTWLRWQLPANYGGGKAYRLNSPSGQFFPTLIKAIDAVPGGKAAVAGSALAQLLGNVYVDLWERSTGQDVTGAAAGIAQNVALGATGGRGVTIDEAKEYLQDTTRAAADMAIRGGSTLGALILSSTLPPVTTTPSAPSDPAEPRAETGPLPPILLGLVLAKLAGAF